MTQARVIVVQQPMKRDGGAERPAFDFTTAREYGVVEILAPNGKHILTPDVFRSMLEDGLAEFDPEKDFVIPVGDYSVLFYVGMLLGQRFSRIRILRWVPGHRAYQPLTLNVGDHRG